jgi:dTDP-4-dehydrorhamnose reductase
MKLLLTGAGGQLGKEIIQMVQAMDDVHLVPFTRQQLDVTNRDAVLDAVKLTLPDIILHTAAYTQVDQAESDAENAFRVNANGSKYLAEAASQLNAKICFVSTDYVFNGEFNRPYREDDPISPLCVYGQSKALGERYIRQLCDRHFIVRTSWLYGAHGSNFVHTMIRLGKDPNIDVVKVVHDQTGCPTWTLDLAQFLVQLISSDTYGTYHAPNTGMTTWYEFAKEIFRLTGIKKQVIPVTTAEFPRPARRPEYSVLSSERMKQCGFEPLPHWEKALANYLESAVGGMATC